MGQLALNLADLSVGMPGLTPIRGKFMAEAASVCLAHCGHPVEVNLSVSGHFTDVSLLQRLDVDKQMENTYRDIQEATEHGAYGVAILGTCRLSGSVVVERSAKGTGFDYWLAKSDDENAPPFVGVQRLEISGILKGDDVKVTSRTAIKSEQVTPSNSVGPAFISIVEFSGPELRITQV